VAKTNQDLYPGLLWVALPALLAVSWNLIILCIAWPMYFYSTPIGEQQALCTCVWLRVTEKGMIKHAGASEQVGKGSLACSHSTTVMEMYVWLMSVCCCPCMHGHRLHDSSMPSSICQSCQSRTYGWLMSFFCVLLSLHGHRLQ
jgi:hypothetical protein